MESNQASICFGEVLHKRTSPKINAFRYSVFYLRIPMKARRASPGLLSQYGVGDNHFSWISFYDRDHGIGGDDSLVWVESELKKFNVTDVDGEIWLHTFPRVLGYTFNPVSFWFCHNAAGQIKAILAEVNNTFGGRHSYLLKSTRNNHIALGEPLTTDKAFHVSPFYDVKGHYLFRFMRRQELDSEAQNVSRIEYWVDGQLQLSTSISGQDMLLSRKNVLRAILQFPISSIGIILKIHWQAIKLWFKGIQFYGKDPLRNQSK
jgi:DUF1365 family protein